MKMLYHFSSEQKNAPDDSTGLKPHPAAVGILILRLLSILCMSITGFYLWFCLKDLIK